MFHIWRSTSLFNGWSSSPGSITGRQSRVTPTQLNLTWKSVEMRKQPPTMSILFTHNAGAHAHMFGPLLRTYIRNALSTCHIHTHVNYYVYCLLGNRITSWSLVVHPDPNWKLYGSANGRDTQLLNATPFPALSSPCEILISIRIRLQINLTNDLWRKINLSFCCKPCLSHPLNGSKFNGDSYIGNREAERERKGGDPSLLNVIIVK